MAGLQQLKRSQSALRLSLVVLLGALSLSAQADPCEQIVLKPVEQVVLLGQFQLRVKARIDTGADLSSLDSELARQVGLDQPVVREILVRNAHGTTRRKVVRVKYILRGQTRTGEFSLIPRDGLPHPVLMGRLSLKGFLVDPSAECAGC